jgi:hypothetical protein
MLMVACECGAKIHIPFLALLCVYGTLLVWIAAWQSPTYNETGHLAAGVRIWQEGQFDLYCVNPPLVKAVAAAPVVWWCPQTDWSGMGTESRAELWMGQRFAEINDRRIIQYVTMARLACIPFGLVGAYICYCWGRTLYSVGAGLTASMLWCFSPYVLGHGSLITADVPAACLGILAAYLLWQWLRQPSWATAVAAGLGLGLAELTKFSWVILFALWPLIWLVCFGLRRCEWNGRTISRHGAMLVTMLALAVLVINAGYGCEGSFQKLGDYRFVSRILGASYTNDGFPHHHAGNRFADSWLAMMPIPLPRNYVRGIDVQNHDFEAGMFSYLRGQWSGRGWWYYYLYALAIKIPLGTWWLVVLAVGVTVFGRGYSSSWRDEIVVLAPFVVFIVVVSSQTGFSTHSRYSIPALPFLFVWTSKIARVFEMRPFTRERGTIAVIAALAMIWSVGSSLAVYPHSLSYFNELAALLPTPADQSYPAPIGEANTHEGQTFWERLRSILVEVGPRNGPRHLLDSNIDWGQDLFYLKDWLEKHPDVTIDGLACWCSYPTTLGGLPQTPLPPTDLVDEQYRDSAPSNEAFGPKPGWYALSVNCIFDRDRHYRHFLHFEPVATAGYSIYIYHITLDGANRVRRKLGLPELGKQSESNSR